MKFFGIRRIQHIAAWRIIEEKIGEHSKLFQNYKEIQRDFKVNSKEEWMKLKPHKCTICGDRCSSIYMVGKVCYGCHIDKLCFPNLAALKNYQKREKYTAGNATKKPPVRQPYLNIRKTQCRDLLISKTKPN